MENMEAVMRIDLLRCVEGSNHPAREDGVTEALEI